MTKGEAKRPALWTAAQAPRGELLCGRSPGADRGLSEANQEKLDVALKKRAAAVKHGAVEITWRELGKMVAERRQRGGPYKDATTVARSSAW